MGGEGSIQGMITTLRNNKKLLRSKRMFKKERSFLNLKQEYFKAAGGRLAFKEASKEDLLKIRQKIIQERTKNTVLFSLVAALIFSCVFYLSIQFLRNERKVEEQQQAAQFKKQEKLFLKYLIEGDEWFEKGSCYNSIFSYERALEIFPDNYDVNYRIVTVYAVQCEMDYKNCFKAKELLESLFVKYPFKKDELIRIKDRLEYEF
ncbi:hypothetical protein [Paucihalobacter sp.]|uniref:hypothetical protein n=2 Tax=Paucihalobacter sp. TaxID=2850405 RepID=UPI002FE17BE0